MMNMKITMKLYCLKKFFLNFTIKKEFIFVVKHIQLSLLRG